MIYFRVKDDTEQGKAFTKYLKTLPYVEQIAAADIPNIETIKAMKDAKEGKVIKYNSTSELFSKLRKKANV
ncbi:MAG: hypothetical protein NTZ69_00245 [Bacteroidia bacterium]|nr:hypothetical protein [Bacteroidia bacterium]